MRRGELERAAAGGAAPRWPGADDRPGCRGGAPAGRSRARLPFSINGGGIAAPSRSAGLRDASPCRAFQRFCYLVRVIFGPSACIPSPHSCSRPWPRRHLIRRCRRGRRIVLPFAPLQLPRWPVVCWRASSVAALNFDCAAAASAPPSRSLPLHSI